MKLHCPVSPHLCVENDSFEFLAECDFVLRHNMHTRSGFP